MNSRYEYEIHSAFTDLFHDIEIENRVLCIIKWLIWLNDVTIFTVQSDGNWFPIHRVIRFNELKIIPNFWEKGSDVSLSYWLDKTIYIDKPIKWYFDHEENRYKYLLFECKYMNEYIKPEDCSIVSLQNICHKIIENREDNLMNCVDKMKLRI